MAVDVHAVHGGIDVSRNRANPASALDLHHAPPTRLSAGAAGIRVSCLSGARYVEEPGALGAIGHLECGGLIVVLPGALDVVETFEQALLAHGMDVESILFAVGPVDVLACEIHRDGGARLVMKLAPQRDDILLRQDQRQYAVFG